jgi:acetyl-CoA carboxylase biotin carboxyl carrier protein
MNDQEGAASAQARDEQQQQQQAKQPERGSAAAGGSGHSRERGRRRHSSPNQPRRAEAPQLPMDELRDLFALFTEHGLTEFELERESFRVHLGRNISQAADTVTQSQAPGAPPLMVTPAPAPETAAGQAASAATVGSAASTQAEQAAAEEESLHIITSPIVGTFYRSSSPTAEPFVRLDSEVSPDTVVCIIEAMKLMNEIQAETSGKIAKIYVENGQPVEYGQPLFGVKK